MSIQFIRKAAAVLCAVAAFAFVASSQQMPSRWYFKMKYNKRIESSWNDKGVAAATESGSGLLCAVKADGSRPDSCIFHKSRLLAGPMEAGDFLVMEFPQTNLPAGSFVEFDMTLSVEKGAPSLWQFEYLDGEEWIPGRIYRLYGSSFEKSHQYTSVLETVKLSSPAEGTLKMRMRALESEPVKCLSDNGPRLAKGIVILNWAYLGAYAQDLGTVAPKDTTKILCLGNSFTYYCSCPALLKEIAWNEGHYLDMTAAMKGGQNFTQHCTLEISEDAVARGWFEVAVLQDQSQTPARLAQDKKANVRHLGGAVNLAAKIREESPDCRFFVESTWSYVNQNGDFGGFDNHKKFEKLNFKGASIMAKAIGGAKVSRIEAAFAIVRNERPDINLFAADNKHQSLLGSYLKSCVNYLTIFGKPFGDSPADCGIDHEVAAYLRDAAERAVL